MANIKINHLIESQLNPLSNEELNTVKGGGIVKLYKRHRKTISRAFSFGFGVGSYLDNKFNLSDRISGTVCGWTNCDGRNG